MSLFFMIKFLKREIQSNIYMEGETNIQGFFQNPPIWQVKTPINLYSNSFFSFESFNVINKNKKGKNNYVGIKLYRVKLMTD